MAQGVPRVIYSRDEADPMQEMPAFDTPFPINLLTNLSPTQSQPVTRPNPPNLRFSLHRLKNSAKGD